MNDLTTPEMAQISGGWFTEGAARTAIAATPALDALMPSMNTAHIGLRNVAPDVDMTVRLKQLADEGVGCDYRHDTTMRGTHVVFTGLSMLASTDVERDRLLALRDFVLPDGLAGTQKSYRGEAGEAALLTQRFEEEPARAAELDAMVLPVDGGITLRTVVNRWMSEATRLGEIDKERVALTGPGTASTTVITPAAARAAREAWMEQVRALRVVAAAVRLSPERHHAIFGELEAAEAKAARRGRAAAVQVTVDPGAKPGA